MDLHDHVAKRIRELRLNYANGKGLSQEALGKELEKPTNTVSRWETGTYRPSLSDLDRIGRFFGVSIQDFLPPTELEAGADEKMVPLMRAAKGLNANDLEEVRKYIEFKRMSAIYPDGVRPRPGRKGKSAK